MKLKGNRLQHLLLPAIVFVMVFAGHYVWHGFFPEHDAAQDSWPSIQTGTDVGWLQRYIEHEDYWLGLSYALSLSFAACAFVMYREKRFCHAGKFALGGVTFTGFLAVAACFLIGCCGSPMLAVYLSLFGAGFLPFIKPLVALITAASILGAWLWMRRQKGMACACADDTCSSGSPPGTGET